MKRCNFKNTNFFKFWNILNIFQNNNQLLSMQKKLTSLASLVETEKLPCTKALKLLAEIQVSTKRTKYNGCAIVFVLSQNVFFFSPFLFPFSLVPLFSQTKPLVLSFILFSHPLSLFFLFFLSSPLLVNTNPDRNTILRWTIQRCHYGES